QYARGELAPPTALTVGVPGREAPLLIDPWIVKTSPAMSAAAASTRSLPLHPAQLYSTFTALLIAAILVCYFSLRPPPGRVMALMLMLEGTTRFLLEMLRAEPPVVTVFGHGWSLSMVLGALLLLAGAILWFAFA